VLIDWFTVAAQAINFLILVLLLRRFLYGPIVKAMDEREAAIIAKTQAAELLQTEAKAEIAAYQQKQADWQAQRAQLLRQTEEEAEARRQTLIQQARQEADQMHQRWQQAVANDRDAFLKNLRRQTGETVLHLSRRALADLVDVSLEERMAAAFTAQLTRLPAADWQQLLQAKSLVVASAWPLDPATQQPIADLVAQQSPDPIPLRFEVDPDLLGGLELRSHSYKIPWTLAGYLDEMEDAFAQALDGQAGKGAK